jgi:hypothetical protein
MRLSIFASVLLVAACGGGGSSSSIDGGDNSDASQPDSNAPPMANCTPLDLAAAAAITITNQQVTPNPQGGALTTGIFKLTNIKLYASGITVTGTAKSRVEFVTGSATSGAARVAVIIDAMAFGQPVQQNSTGAGLYTTTSTALNLTDGCGGTNPLAGLTYTATPTGLTLWTTYMVTNPVALTIPIELLFAPE